MNLTSTETKEASVSQDTEVSVDINISVSYEVEGLGGIEASLSSSKSYASGGEQSVTLEPSEMINEYMGTVVLQATIEGSLYEKASGKYIGPVFVGLAKQTIISFYLDDREPID